MHLYTGRLKLVFSAKIYEIWKKCWDTKLFIPKRSKNLLWPFFNWSYIFRLLLTNVIKNENFWFPKKNYTEYKTYDGDKIVLIKLIFLQNKEINALIYG